MIQADLAFPFGAGLVAAFNPCGFAMLPVYLSVFVGSDHGTSASPSKNLLRALRAGAALTAGFVAVFGSFGVATSTLLQQRAILENTPYITAVLGVLLVPLGIAMLFGYELNLAIPRLQRGGESNELWSIFLFGVSYAIVSLGCTVAVFVTGVASVFTKDGFLEGMAVFIAYALGMSAVILTLTVALALARTSVASSMRRALPWINRISGALLLFGGIYLAIYGWWEIQVLRGNLQEISVVSFFSDFQGEINTWIDRTGSTRLGIGLLILVAACLLGALWSGLAKEVRTGLAIGLGVLWLWAELGWQRADLFILPTIRTIGDAPSRAANWFADPMRWAVLGEILFVALLVLIMWSRFRPNRDQPAPASP